MEKIVFNKAGYDPFIDYLKAYSIFFVVFAHCLPVEIYNYTLFWVWGSMQVPMFILVQSFHAYKKGVCPTINVLKIFKRIIFPFILVQTFIFSIFIVFSSHFGKDELLKFVIGGGEGPGSYYFWIYLQVAFLLPLLWSFVSKASKYVQLFTFLFMSVGFEVLFSIINLPDCIYRLLATRYFFLIYFAYNWWVRDGVVINVKTLVMSLLSISAILFFIFTDINLEPVFFNTDWKIHRWICYYYVASLLVYVVWFIYKKVGKVKWLDSLIRMVGRCSYEIYLMQMLVFVFLGGRLNFISETLLRVPLYMILTTSLSLLLGIGCKMYVIDKCKFLKT